MPILGTAANAKPGHKNKNPTWSAFLNVLMLTEDSVFRQRMESGFDDTNPATISVHSQLESALDLLSKPHNFDLLVIDFALPKLNGLKDVEKLVRANPDLRSVLFLDEPYEDIGHQARRMGVHATASKNLSDQVLRLVSGLLENECVFSVRPYGLPRRRGDNPQDLSRRELQILSLLCDGQQNKEIAHAFGIQEVTVKMHMRAIIRKLSARNRTHAAIIARDRGMV